MSRNRTDGEGRGGQRGIYLRADTPLVDRPLAVEDGSGDKAVLAEVIGEILTLSELDGLINQLIQESNEQHRQNEHDPARLGDLAEFFGNSCADCGRNAPVYGPINFDGELHEGGDFCCETCAADRGVIWRRERHESAQKGREASAPGVEYDFPELDLSDVLYLQELENLHGRERVLGWLRGKTAVPLKYQFGEDDFDEDAYFEAMRAHYVETGEGQ